MEHDAHPLVGLAQQQAATAAPAAQREAAGGTGPHPQLVFDPGAYHVVGLAHGAVGIDPDLGHDEQRDAPGAGRGSLDARQHRVDDVFGQVLLAAGDEYLASGDGVGPVAQRPGTGFQGPHVAAGVRLGEQHRAAPLSGVHLLEKEPFLIFGAEQFDELAGAVAEARVHDKRAVGTGEVLAARQAGQHRKPLATDRLILAHGDPPALTVEREDAVKGLGDPHRAIGEGATGRIPRAVGGGDLPDGQLARLADDQVDGLAVEAVKTRVAEQGFQLELFVEHKVDVAPVG